MFEYTYVKNADAYFSNHKLHPVAPRKDTSIVKSFQATNEFSHLATATLFPWNVFDA
jgi:hypothetical protein